MSGRLRELGLGRALQASLGGGAVSSKMFDLIRDDRKILWSYTVS